MLLCIFLHLCIIDYSLVLQIGLVSSNNQDDPLRRVHFQLANPFFDLHKAFPGSYLIDDDGPHSFFVVYRCNGTVFFLSSCILHSYYAYPNGQLNMLFVFKNDFLVEVTRIDGAFLSVIEVIVHVFHGDGGLAYPTFIMTRGYLSRGLQFCMSEGSCKSNIIIGVYHSHKGWKSSQFQFLVSLVQLQLTAFFVVTSAGQKSVFFPSSGGLLEERNGVTLFLLGDVWTFEFECIGCCNFLLRQSIFRAGILEVDIGGVNGIGLFGGRKFRLEPHSILIFPLRPRNIQLLILQLNDRSRPYLEVKDGRFLIATSRHIIVLLIFLLR